MKLFSLLLARVRTSNCFLLLLQSNILPVITKIAILITETLGLATIYILWKLTKITISSFSYILENKPGLDRFLLLACLLLHVLYNHNDFLSVKVLFWELSLNNKLTAKANQPVRASSTCKMLSVTSRKCPLVPISLCYFKLICKVLTRNKD